MAETLYRGGRKAAIWMAIIFAGIWAVVAFGPLRESHWGLRFVFLPLFVAYLWATPPSARRGPPVSRQAMNKPTYDELGAALRDARQRMASMCEKISNEWGHYDGPDPELEAIDAMLARLGPPQTEEPL